MGSQGVAENFATNEKKNRGKKKKKQTILYLLWYLYYYKFAGGAAIYVKNKNIFCLKEIIFYLYSCRVIY